MITYLQNRIPKLVLNFETFSDDEVKSIVLFIIKYEGSINCAPLYELFTNNCTFNDRAPFQKLNQMKNIQLLVTPITINNL